jgi:hypothetical protein
MNFTRKGNEMPLYVSAKGFDKIAKEFDPKEPGRNMIWTSDMDLELPIVLTTKGPGKLKSLLEFTF